MAFQAEWHTVAAPSLRFLQWNTLSATLCTRDSFPHVVEPDVSLNNDARFERMIAMLRDVGADVIGLQEVDPETNRRICAALSNYGSAYWPGAVHGLMLLWRIPRLVHLHSQQLQYTETSQRAGIVTLKQDEPGGAMFAVAVTHLKAKPEFASVRFQQVKQLVDRIQFDVPVVLLGDFNDTPDSDSVLHMCRYMRSAYPHDPSKFTTSKMRGDGVLVERTIDYIFVTPRCRVLEMLTLPARHMIPDCGLPSPLFPSDHLMIGAAISVGPL